MPLSDVEKRRRARLRARVWLKAYLAEHPCVDCGEDDIRVLEFDHVCPENKVANVGRMACDGCSVKRLEIEVAKCEVRCANCHRRRTRKEGHASFRRIVVLDAGG
jgi:hypothetical protein